MVNHPDPLIDKLLRRLHDADPVVRQNAAGALRLHGERAADAISQLGGLLSDENDKVRTEAQRALNRLRRAVA